MGLWDDIKLGVAASWDLGLAGVASRHLLGAEPVSPKLFAEQAAADAERGGASPAESDKIRFLSEVGAREVVATGDQAVQKLAAAGAAALGSTLSTLKIALYIAAGVAVAVLVLLYAPRRRG